MRLMRYYLPTLLRTRRDYVWAPSKLVTKPSDICATVRSWTDGRPDSLRSKTVVASHLVAFTHAMHVCRSHSCVGLYGSVINAFLKTNLRVRTRSSSLARQSH
eukprot:5015061-Pleurochrysis_carterae.AAC.1